jgi:5'-3' exonuclease
VKNVLIIDTMNMLHRARYGFGDGPHKVYFNFFRMLMGEMKAHKPDLVYVVDEGRATISKDLSENYKSNRQKLDDPDFWREKSEVFHSVINHSGLTYVRHPHRECDDVIGHLASVTHKNDNVVIVSSDSDFIQLISDNVKLWQPKQKKFVEPWHCDYITWKALRGDPTDNISGVSGIGPKRADVLAADPAALKEFLDTTDADRAEQFRVSYELVKLKEVPLEDLQVAQSNFAEKQFFEEFQKRNCKSIIGNAWPKWVQAFTTAGGKNDLEY